MVWGCISVSCLRLWCLFSLAGLVLVRGLELWLVMWVVVYSWSVASCWVCVVDFVV